MCEASLPRADGAFEIFHAWWADLPTRHGSSTVRQYRYHVLRTFADLGKDPAQVGRAELARHLRAMRPQYGAKVRRALNDFFEFLVRRGLREENPLAEVRIKVKGGRRIRRGLSEEELVRLVLAALWGPRPRNEHQIDGQRLAWTITAQYALGLRPGEICRLRASEVQLNGEFSCVYITDTKTGNDRIVPMGPTARAALTELMRDRPGMLVGLGTSQYWEHVSRAARMAGIPLPKRRPYALRHTFGTRLAELGVHQSVISELMGHSDLRASRWYVVPSDDQLRQAVGML
ncbi:MAG: tyrosine-type recombinase/integrase [Actinomycetota bacterium]